MTQKHQGGRGRRAPAKTKQIVVAVSLSPSEKALLDSWMNEATSRSEVVAQLIRAHAAQLGQTIPSAESQDAPAQAPQKPRKVASEALKGKSPPKESDELSLIPVIGAKGSLPDILKSLEDGAKLARSGRGWMLTELDGTTRRVNPNVIRVIGRKGLVPKDLLG
jgi:hypothetical protein